MDDLEATGTTLQRLADNSSSRQPKRFPVRNDLHVVVCEEFDDVEDASAYSNTLWDGAVVASAFFRRHPGLCAGRRVLEIGAGLGLPALAVAALGAREVVATEKAPLTLLRRQLAFNEGVLAAVGGGRLAVAELDWAWSSERIAALGSFDVVLGCDILAGVCAHAAHFDDVLRCVRILAPRGQAFLTWTPRCCIELERFLCRVEPALGPNWSCRLLPAELVDPDFRSGGDVEEPIEMLHLVAPACPDPAFRFEPECAGHHLV